MHDLPSKSHASAGEGDVAIPCNLQTIVWWSDEIASGGFDTADEHAYSTTFAMTLYFFFNTIVNVRPLPGVLVTVSWP